MGALCAKRYFIIHRRLSCAFVFFVGFVVQYEACA